MTTIASLAKFAKQIWLRFGKFLPLIILLISLAFTYLVWNMERASSKRELETEFDALRNEASYIALQRMNAYVQMLNGVGALFAHANSLERREFHDYIDKLHLKKEYPGIQSVGFVLIVPASQKNSHIATVRKQGFPTYSIKPEGERDTYTSIFYVEPFAELNRRTLGYDVYTEPVFHNAMEVARDSGEATLSGNIRQLHEEQELRQIGASIFLPIYRHNAPSNTLKERRANIIGWIYAPLNMEYLMSDILSNQSAALDIEIYDGEKMSVQTMLYDPDMRLAGDQSDALFKSVQRVTIANHTLTMAISSLPAFESHLEQGKSSLFVFSGITASLLLSLFFWLRTYTQKRDQQFALMQTSYNSMFDNTLDAALLLQGEIIVNCNIMSTILLGRSRAEIIGHSLSQFSPLTQPDGNFSHIKFKEKFISQQTGVEQEIFEWQLKRTDGSLIDSDVALRTVTIGGQNQSFASFRDITRRKQSELAQLHAILEASPDAVLMVEDDGLIHFANSVAEKLFGYSMEHLIGLNVDMLVPMHTRIQHDKLRKKFKFDPHARAMGTGKSLTAKRHDGSEIPVEISLSPIRISDKNRVIAVVHDISARKRNEIELLNSLEEARNANQRLNLQFNRMPLAYIVWNRDFVVTEWNPAAELMFGWTEAEAVGQHAYDLIVPADAQETVNSMWDEVLHGKEMSLHSVNENVTKSEKRITCEWFNTPLRNDRDEIYGCMSMVSDITHRKLAEQELIELNEGLELRVSLRTNELARAKELAEAGSHAKSEFLANMSHEIRTPMNSVLGMAYLALKTDLNPKQRDYLEKIHHSGEHLLGIINDILDFSKIEAGKLDIEMIDFKLDSVLKNLTSLVAEKAQAKGLQLTINVAPDIPHCLTGDPLRLSQVLINYVNNAIKFTQRGEIKVSVTRVAESQGKLTLLFEVQDSGIGMSQEAITKLFQPFQQADGSTTRKFGGTGLGLAISKRLVTMMGGEVGVTSSLGAGSTFWFNANFEQCGTPECCISDSVGIDKELVQAGQPLSAMNGARILLADDNLFNQQVASELLEGVGAHVTAASNGAEALDLLRKSKYDCVLMDVQMPVMDGLEATRRIRADSTLAKLPVIAMTANARKEDKDQCFSAGMDDFLTKPLLPELLYSTLERWLSRQRQQTASDTPVIAADTSLPPLAPVTTFIEVMLTGDPAIINLSVLAKMVNDDPEKIRKFANKFLESTDKGMTEIVEALAQSNYRTLAAVGHRIKSAARTVGAIGFADLCQALEQCDKDNDLDKAKDIVAKLQALLEVIREHIQAYLAKPA